MCSPKELKTTRLLRSGSKEFFRAGWNIFDIVVVAIGTLSLLRVDTGPLKLVRNMRAFRVFRLFQHVDSLAKILRSIVTAIPGVANAFMIMVIVMCIYAVLAVEFFNMHGKGGHMTIYEEDDWGKNYTVRRGSYTHGARVPSPVSGSDSAEKCTIWRRGRSHLPPSRTRRSSRKRWRS